MTQKHLNMNKTGLQDIQRK